MSTTCYYVNLTWADGEAFICNVGTPNLRSAFDLLREGVDHAVERGYGHDVHATIHTLIHADPFSQDAIDGWVARMVADPNFEVEGSGRDRKASAAHQALIAEALLPVEAELYV
jgi:hypothetical protein